MLSVVLRARLAARRGVGGFASLALIAAALSVPAVVAVGCGDGGADADVAADRPTNVPGVAPDEHESAVAGSSSTTAVATRSSVTAVVGRDGGRSAVGASPERSIDADPASSSTTTVRLKGEPTSSPTTTTTAPTTAHRPAPRTGAGRCAGVEAILSASVADRAAASSSAHQRRYWADDPDTLKATLFSEPPFRGWSARNDGGCSGPSGNSGFCGDSYDDKLALNERRLDVLYSRGWNDEGSYNTGEGLILQTVYEFETTKGAAAYLEDAARYACSRPDVVETFEVQNVQGAIGFTLAKEYDTSPLIDVVLYSRGPRMYRLFWLTGRLTDHVAMVDLAGRAAARST